MTTRGGGGERPLRRDAERNRQRILHAAAEVFTQRGLDATLDDVAREAGVGVGTVYRRFPDKESLVAELFADRIDAMVGVAEQALAAPDPWQALVSYLEYAAETMASSIGLRQLMMFATYGRDRVAYARERNAPLIGRLVERAQAAGQVRGDLAPTDIPFIIFTLAQATEFSRHSSPELWRRYLALFLDGLRPDRAGVTALPVPAMLPDEMEKAMRESAPRRL